MAMSSPVSRRYATALVEAAAKEGAERVEKVADEIQRTAALLGGSPDLKNVLLNPVFTPAERAKVLEAVMQKLALSDLVRRFLKLLVDGDRIGELNAIARAVRRMADLRAGIVRAEVTAASALSPDAVASLRRALEKRTGRQVELELSIDPSLLGGVRARIGSTVIDGTLRSQLEQLREGLLRSE
jgi:F-type H+-transporting ATPase subunit delta